MDTSTIDRPAVRTKQRLLQTAEVKTVNLALQGAFAWGVLDRFLEDERILFEGVSMSKFNADWEFLIHLRDGGHEFVSSWLDENFVHIGLESTIDVHERYL
jgi:hypothetical protein